MNYDPLRSDEYALVLEEYQYLGLNKEAFDYYKERDPSLLKHAITCKKSLDIDLYSYANICDENDFDGFNKLARWSLPSMVRIKKLLPDKFENLLTILFNHKISPDDFSVVMRVLDKLYEDQI